VRREPNPKGSEFLVSNVSVWARFLGLFVEDGLAFGFSALTLMPV